MSEAAPRPSQIVSGRKLVSVFVGLLLCALAAYGVVRWRVFEAHRTELAAEAARRAPAIVRAQAP